MWKRTRFLLLYSSLNFFIFRFLQFSNIKNFISLFSGTERHTKLKLGPHMNRRLMYHVYLNQAAGVYLFIPLFLQFSFSQIPKLQIFCHTFLWGLYTHGQRVDLLCTPSTSSQNIFIPLFFFFFLSLQLAKLKNLFLQNCFNILLIATAGGVWALLTLCYIFLIVELSALVKILFIGYNFWPLKNILTKVHIYCVSYQDNVLRARLTTLAFLVYESSDNNRVLTVISDPYKMWAATWQNQQNGCAPSKDSDQPGHSLSLIRVFAVRMKKAWVLS